MSSRPARAPVPSGRAAPRATTAAALAALAALIVAAVALWGAAGGALGPATTGGASARASAAGSTWARLVSASTPLRAAGGGALSVAVRLRSRRRPELLESWADAHGLSARWEPGADFAVLAGGAKTMAAALDVAVIDYRTPGGRPLLAAARPAEVPSPLSTEVASIGRIGSFRLAAPVVKGARQSFLSYVPTGGLDPAEVAQAYGAEPLRQAGYDGSGETIVLFDWSPPRQSDLDQFTASEHLPPLHPVLAAESGTPFADAGTDSASTAEADLDAEVAHELAPGARLVVFDAVPSVNDEPAAIATLFEDAASRYPGAIWSISIGWLCDRFYTWSDLEAVNSAIATAEASGTTVFDAAGDTDGLECKEDLQEAYDTPPGPQDVGVDAIASLPAVTSVGGTALSTTASGSWYGEVAWDDSVMAIGTGGGVSTVIPRPSWQEAPGVGTGLGANQLGYREVPDVAADADPRTGIRVVIGGVPQQSGGTSQAAPIWAGLTALVDQYLARHGGHPIGAIDPALYRLARSPQPYPPLHDITLGGNATHFAGAGYDLVTGLGSPQTYNLAWDLLAYEKSGR